MKIKYKEKRTIADKMVEAITEAEKFHTEVDTIYLNIKEYDEFRAEVPLNQLGHDLWFYGVKIIREPDHDLFHDNEFWVECGMLAGYTGVLLTLDGKIYRRV